jgi:hypothetical protein
MKHYRALKTIVDGQAIYGNLPSDFVYCYDHDGYGYFRLLDSVSIPDGATAEEISESDYKAAFHTVAEKHRNTRAGEQAKFVQAMKERETLRQQEMDNLKAEIKALKARPHSSA